MLKPEFRNPTSNIQRLWNSAMDKKAVFVLSIPFLLFAGFCFAGFCFSGCGASFTGPARTISPDAENIELASEKSESVEYASPEVLEMYERGLDREYLIGPGDVLEIVSPHRPELAGQYVVGPDGAIAVFMAGEIELSGLTRQQAEDRILEKTGRFYQSVAITLKINKYRNNKVYVLGRVDNPGVIEFDGRPTLLEALSIAAPFPPVQKAAFLSRCAIMRGRDQILWIDLQQLLRGGNTKLNITLANNDVVYIPDPQDSNVFLMGEVRAPGSYEIRDALTLLNAIGMAGGVTENAVTSGIKLIRDRGLGGGVVEIDLDEMMATADFSQNYLLKNSDIVFVPRRGIATFNYYLRQIDPFVQLLIVAETLQKSE